MYESLGVSRRGGVGLGCLEPLKKLSPSATKGGDRTTPHTLTAFQLSCHPVSPIAERVANVMILNATRTNTKAKVIRCPVVFQ